MMKEETARNGVSRRNFVKGAATVAAVGVEVFVKPMLGGKASVAEAAPAGSASDRSHECFNYRKNAARYSFADLI